MLIIGDIGGTSAKLALATNAGSIETQVFGPGANLHSAGGLPTFENSIALTLAHLLEVSAVNPQHIDLSYFAVSGAGPARIDVIRKSCQKILSSFAISSKVVVTDDIAAAFMANAEKASSGVLALSGTGALTASIKNRRIIKRFDGLGWVLGDIGSGLWFGHQALISCASDSILFWNFSRFEKC
ncbi:MAG: hypothetical protein MR006_02820 [Arcanobacterium sp.]|nr:hypothetical protein [Arcanobacterium sp.]